MVRVLASISPELTSSIQMNLELYVYIEIYFGGFWTNCRHCTSIIYDFCSYNYQPTIASLATTLSPHKHVYCSRAAPCTNAHINWGHLCKKPINQWTSVQLFHAGNDWAYSLLSSLCIDAALFLSGYWICLLCQIQLFLKSERTTKN